ncbi:MAG TPA: 6,7-dimethyl-8-ribityllumazine synthase [Egibacteraceae bacterium]|jgi:6,7-dimethyl-8-ribityllumazine synthase|nr:6,7-dimethyl-8-ribityllumazine synthase [Egibacteraceae bacterium]
MKVHEGSLDASGLRIGLVAARFNETVVRRLVDGAVDCLRRHGASEDDIELAWTPGAYELPAVVRRMAGTGRFDALVALGCVIRGRTPHFDYVAGEAALVGRVAAETGVPVTFGVLTTEDSDQAAERSGGKLGNKGWDAAQAAIETARLLADLK